LLVEKNHVEFLKKLTLGTNDAERVICARFRQRRRPPFRVVKTLIESKNHKLAQKEKNEIKKTVVMAQTTHFASFGPVLANATHTDLFRVVKTSIEPKNHQLV
jgi:hypothetical protein